MQLNVCRSVSQLPPIILETPPPAGMVVDPTVVEVVIPEGAVP